VWPVGSESGSEGSRSVCDLLETRGAQKAFEQRGIAWPCFQQDGAGDATGGIAEGERDDDHIIERPDHGKELWNQVDRRDDPDHRHQDSHLRAAWHAWVVAQPTDHGDAGGEEPGQLLHEPRREASGQHDEHRPRHEQTPDADEDDSHWAIVMSSVPDVNRASATLNLGIAVPRSHAEPEMLGSGAWRGTEALE